MNVCGRGTSVRGVNDSPEQIAEPSSDVQVAVPTAAPPLAEGAQPIQADLERIEADLAGVESALDRLDAGTYWSDELTGDPIPDELLIADPVTRRAG
jgi:RNA polymerase-binding transcription factor DksA